MAGHNDPICFPRFVKQSRHSTRLPSREFLVDSHFIYIDRYDSCVLPRRTRTLSRLGINIVYERMRDPSEIRKAFCTY